MSGRGVVVGARSAATPSTLTPPRPATTLAQRIDDTYRDLSPQEQRGADFLRDHLADLAVYNATEVARLSGVSKATISRLYRRLGFEGADELRAHVRALRASGVPIAPGVVAAGAGAVAGFSVSGVGAASGYTAPVIAAHLDRERANLHDTLADLDLRSIARPIATAGRVLVIGFRNSYPVALHLREQLAQARAGVELAPLPGQSVGEDLAALSSEDAVVLVGFRRRPEAFERVLDAARSTGATVVLLGDPSARRYAASVNAFVECPIESVTAFDSYASAFSVVSLIADAVLTERMRDGAARVARISSLYEELGELERS